jgi:serine/threonine protein kinase
MGVCMYEMMTLEYPFDDFPPCKLMNSIISKEIREIDFPKEYSSEIKQLICKMLIKVCVCMIYIYFY